jgi:hypothetical protein
MLETVIDKKSKTKMNELELNELMQVEGVLFNTS